jgi:hypothetical protein
MMIASHRSGTLRAAAVFARSPFRLIALLPVLISLAIPATAWGDIYKWTDDKGAIVYSDSPPPTSGKVKNVEVVQKVVKPTSTEQALLARINALERQQQALQQPPQYAAQPPTVPPPMPYPTYYPPAPSPPPPPSYYDSGYDSGYYSSAYSSYPAYYPNYYPSYAYPVYPARVFVPRPVFAAPRGGSFRGGGGSFHGGGGHGGGHGGRR